MNWEQCLPGKLVDDAMGVGAADAVESGACPNDGATVELPVALLTLPAVVLVTRLDENEGEPAAAAAGNRTPPSLGADEPAF